MNHNLRKKNKKRAGGGVRSFFLPSLFLSLCIPLTACKADILPPGREGENMALMRTMGVDAAETDGVRVTVSSGVQSKGADKGDEPPQVFYRDAGTVSGACLAMQSYGTAYIFYGHVGQLLVGEALAERGLAEALDYVERDIEMRLDTELFVVKGAGAFDAIASAATGTSSAADRLEALEDDAGLRATSATRTVKDVLAGQAQNGASFAPAITLTSGETGNGAGEGTDLSAAGFAIIKDNALAGWADGDAARGINLLLGQVDADVLELDLPGGGKAALRIVGSAAKVRPVFQDGTLAALEVSCQVDANVAEAPAALDLSDDTVRRRLNAALVAAEEARIRAALDLSQSLDADFMGLKKWAGLSAPWHWDALKDQWAGRFSRLEIRLRVEGDIQRSYDVKQ